MYNDCVMATFRELTDRRNELKEMLRERSLYPWRFRNRVGRLESSEGLHPSYGMTWRQWLKAHTQLIAQGRKDRRFKLYQTVNCFYVVRPDGEVHEYFGYSAHRSFENHVIGVL